MLNETLCPICGAYWSCTCADDANRTEWLEAMSEEMTTDTQEFWLELNQEAMKERTQNVLDADP